MAIISYLYKNQLSSFQFNKRFSDFLGGSVLSGYELVLGTNENFVTIAHGGDATSVLITRDGVRIEEEFDVINAFQIRLNDSATTIRRDSLYAKYIHGTRDATVQYEVVEGNVDGTAAPREDEEFYTLLGYINVPFDNESISSKSFEMVTRGLILRNVSNQPTFKKGLEVIGNILIQDEPTLDSHATNKKYVDDQIVEVVTEIASPLDTFSTDYDEEKKVFKVVEYKRQDNTLHSRSALSNIDENGNMTTLTIIFFKEDGTTEAKTEIWTLGYDGKGNITSKTLA